MDANDERHGSYAGAVQHWLTGTPICGPCGSAAYRYVKKNRLEAAEGNPRTVPILGTRRRIRALCALGYSYNQIGEAMGSDRRHVQLWAASSKTTVLRSTAERVADVYERLAMRVPDNSNNRLEYFRLMARRKGWAPPLAWDDIDDPDEEPTDFQHVAADRATAVRELADQGEGPTQIARRLDISVRALERWCQRHIPDTWRTIAAREADWNAPANNTAVVRSDREERIYRARQNRGAA